MLRYVWIACGSLAVALGVVGLFLPLVPTVPFLLAGAFCFARSSQALHDRLLAHPTLGPPIRDWNERGAIRRSAKWVSTVSIVAAVALSFVFGLAPWIIAIQVATLVCVALFIWTRPEA